MKNRLRYRIELLDSDSFDRLKFNHARTALGISLPDSGKAYIRRTGDRDEDIDTLIHEIEELDVPQSWHEEAENGVRVRYKKWGKFFRSIFDPGSQRGTIFGSIMPSVTSVGLGAIPGVGPLLATGYGAYAGANRGGGVTGGLLGALQGYGLGGLGSGVAGGLGNWMNSGGTGFLKDFGSGFSNAFNSYGINPQISNALGFGNQSTPGGNFPSNPTTAGSTSAAGGVLKTNAPKGSKFFDLSNVFKDKNIFDFLPAGISLGALLGTSAPTIPATPSIQWPMANKPDVQSALTNYQGLMQPQFDVQYQNYINQIKPIASEQGWLDSTYYANMLTDYLKQQNALMNSQIPGLLGQQYETNAQLATLPYQTQLQQYLNDIEQRNRLQGNLGSSIMDFFSPQSELEKKLLAFLQ